MGGGFRFFIFILLLVALSLSRPAAACEGGVPAQTVPVPESIEMVCTDTPPVIDGKLDDTVWADAAVITELFQVEPVEGAAPSERTEVRLLYDADMIYVAVRAFDGEPDKIRAMMQARDGTQNTDDHISLVFDTFNNRRDAFVFQINALGARTDMLVQNNRSQIPEWDGIWYGDAALDAQGWTAEVAIPVKTLSFTGGTREWGFNIVRFIRRKNETIRWSSVDQDLRFENVSQIGRLRNLNNLDQGLGLDVQVSGAMGYVDRKKPGGDDFEVDPSLNVFYKFTPSLTGALTFNTDFAETVADTRQVNLTRFNLFFPETRDFFLQDVGVFEFGDRVSSDVNGRPFFSRRVGLANNEIVDIIAGVKLAGRVDDLNIGLLDVQTDSQGGIDGKNLAVARMSYNVLSDSSVGMMFTNGDPSSNNNNTLIGADFRYRDSQFRGHRVLEGAAWFQKSFSTGMDEGEWAYGASLAYPNDKINWKFAVQEFGENFNPALGFVNRAGVRHYEGKYRYRLRPKTDIRTFDFSNTLNIYTDRDNHLETAIDKFLMDVTNNVGDNLQISATYNYEDLAVPFRLPSDVTIAPGDYTFTRGRIQLFTTPARPVALFMAYECCSYFDGWRRDIHIGMGLRLSKYFLFRSNYQKTRIDVPGGTAKIRLSWIVLDFNLTPNLKWGTLVQYDNLSDDLGFNSRLRWIINPGSEFFFVVNQNVLVDDGNFQRRVSEATVKLGHTFRF